MRSILVLLFLMSPAFAADLPIPHAINHRVLPVFAPIMRIKRRVPVPKPRPFIVNRAVGIMP